MARTRTLGNLRDEVRDRADIEGSTHITDPQINRYVNQSGAALHSMLVEMCEDEFLEVFSGSTSAASGNQTNINVGYIGEVTAGAYKILGVEVVVNGNRVPLRRWSWREHAALIDSPSSGPPYFYRWVSSTVQVIPGLPTSTPYYVYAIPPYVDMAADDETIDGRDGWEEWIVLDAAIKCMTKEESDPSVLVAERDRVYQRIVTQMMQRDFANPGRVGDAMRDGPSVLDVVTAGRMAP